MNKKIKFPNILLILILICFFIIPFFWLKPGEMDLGGDSSRLYFYDPISYLKNVASLTISPDGSSIVFPSFFMLPYVIFLVCIKFVVQSPYFLITIFNILKLLGGFLAIYYFILEVFKVTSEKNKTNSEYSNKCSALLAAIFYILSPLITGNWDKALFFHDQIFVYPIILLLIFKFFLTNNLRYIWLVLFLSIIFSPLLYNPGFFAFFPLIIFYLILFFSITKTNKVSWNSWKMIIFMIVIMLGLHAFHFIPQLVNIFDPNSLMNLRVFNRDNILNEGVRYFIAILPLAKVSTNILLVSDNIFSYFFRLLIPLIIILALIIVKKKQKIFLVTGLFFLFTLFLLSANITNLGNEFYKQLFYIPGFSMFRNFIGQWAMVFMFFYSLLLGQALKIIFEKWGETFCIYFSCCFILLCFLSSGQFLMGAQINKSYSGSNSIHIPMQIDSNYENFLEFIKKIPDEGKILILPFSDSFYQVLAGEKGGAYIGPSSISYLTGKQSFSGYQIMTAPFSERFFALTRENDVEAIKKLLSVLSIKYIFYNSDKKVYDSDFPSSPYSYARQSLPTTQKEYRTFVASIAGEKIFEKGHYQLFSLQEEHHLPLFYRAKEVDFYRGVNKDNIPNSSIFLEKQNNELFIAYVDEHNCNKKIFSVCKGKIVYKDTPDIAFSKIDPTKYKVKVKGAKAPYVLVFNNSYHSSWKIFFAEREIVDKKHFIVNGYANAWVINPSDTENLKDYELVVEMTRQRVFYASLGFSSVVFVLFMAWGVLLFFPKIFAAIIRKSHV